MNRYKDNSKTEEERETTEVDFGVTPQILHEEYLDVYEGIQSEIVNSTRFNENSDLIQHIWASLTKQEMTN